MAVKMKHTIKWQKKLFFRHVSMRFCFVYMRHVFFGNNAKKEKSIQICNTKNEAIEDEDRVTRRKERGGIPEYNARDNRFENRVPVKRKRNIALGNNESDDGGDDSADRRGISSAYDTILFDENIVKNDIENGADNGEPHRQSRASDAVECGAEEIKNCQEAESEHEDLQYGCRGNVFIAKEEFCQRRRIGGDENVCWQENYAGIAHRLCHYGTQFFCIVF